MGYTCPSRIESGEVLLLPLISFGVMICPNDGMT
jgi:hypothetical protein